MGKVCALMKAIVIEESGPWSLTFSFHHSTAPLQLRAVSSVTRAEAGDSSAPAAAGLRRDGNLILWWLGLLGLNQVGKLTHTTHHSQQNSNNIFFFWICNSNMTASHWIFLFFGNCWHLLNIYSFTWNWWWRFEVGNGVLCSTDILQIL